MVFTSEDDEDCIDDYGNKDKAYDEGGRKLSLENLLQEGGHLKRIKIVFC